ncbi:MAG: cell division protein ZapB [Planctomycetota bacterium]|nr:cell division protein ZapB [Planctomycetota bacterium]
MNCSECATALDVPESFVGKVSVLPCPACHQQTKLPSVSIEASAEAGQATSVVQPPIQPQTNADSARKLESWHWYMLAAAGGLALAVVAMAASRPAHAPVATPLPQQIIAVEKEDVVDTAGILIDHTDRLKKEIDELQEKNAELRESLQQLRDELQKTLLENETLQEKVVLINRWRQATFVVYSRRGAVGIEPTNSGQFRVVSTAVYPHTDYVLQVVRKLNIPRAFQADRVALQLCEQAEREYVSKDAEVNLRKLWHEHKPVAPAPGEDATFVMFKDLVTGQDRLGFLLDTSEDSFTFQPVRRSIEKVSRDQIESGTARRGTADRILAEPEADYLDVAILRLAQELASDEGVPGLLSVAVKVQTDALAEEVRFSKEPGLRLTRMFDDRTLSGLDPHLADASSEPARILRRFAEYLHDEIGSRLSRLNIPVVEREELGSLIAERDLADTRSFEPRDYAGLVSASHVVIADVDKPRNGGDFRVSIRLVEADTGHKIFEDNGDVGRKPLVIPERYLLSSGRLALLRNVKNRFVARDQMASLELPADLNTTPAGRIVLLEPNSGDRQAYQELFGHQLREFSDRLLPPCKPPTKLASSIETSSHRT